MHKIIFVALIFSCALFAPELRQKVVILDTGISSTFPPEFLCSEDHKDFTGYGLEDHIGHGTNIAWLLTDYIDNKKQCIVIIKWFHDASRHNLRSTFPYIQNIPNVKWINMSFGGDVIIPTEWTFISNALKKGIVVVAAAGNLHEELSVSSCNYYPACYNFIDKNFHVVGSLTRDGKQSKFSNFGPVVNCWERGEYNFGFGTSFATPVCLGKIIKGAK